MIVIFVVSFQLTSSFEKSTFEPLNAEFSDWHKDEKTRSVLPGKWWMFMNIWQYPVILQKKTEQKAR